MWGDWKEEMRWRRSGREEEERTEGEDGISRLERWYFLVAECGHILMEACGGDLGASHILSLFLGFLDLHKSVPNKLLAHV